MRHAGGVLIALQHNHILAVGASHLGVAALTFLVLDGHVVSFAVAAAKSAI